MTELRVARLTVLLGSALTIAGCSFGAPRSRAELATADACRQRADEIYQRQNRGEVYSIDRYATTTRDAPFATSGTRGLTSAGLSQRFNRDNMMQNCMSANGVDSRAPISRDLQSNIIPH